MTEIEQEYGNAKLALHNAKQTVEALEKKFRRRTNDINAHRVELAQLEHSLPSLTEKLEKAKTDLKTARQIYRALRREVKHRTSPL